MLLVLAAGPFEKATATFLLVIVVVGIVYGGYRLMVRFEQRHRSDDD